MHPAAELDAWLDRQLRAAGPCIPQLLDTIPQDATWASDGRFGPQPAVDSAAGAGILLKASDHVRESCASWAASSAPRPEPYLTLWKLDERATTPTVRAFVVRGALMGLSEVEESPVVCAVWGTRARRREVAMWLASWWSAALAAPLEAGCGLASYAVDIRWVPGMPPVGEDSDDEDARVPPCLARLQPLVVRVSPVSNRTSPALFEWAELGVEVEGAPCPHHYAGTAEARAAAAAHAAARAAAARGTRRALRFRTFFSDDAEEAEAEAGEGQEDGHGEDEDARALRLHYPRLAAHGFPDELLDLASDALSAALAEAGGGSPTGEARAAVLPAPTGGWQGMVAGLEVAGLFRVGNGGDSEED
jgi:hypothetical protein